VKPCPDLDIEDLEHLSRRAPLDESTVDVKASDNLFTPFSWTKIHFLTLNWVVLPRSRVDVEEMLDLRHQDLCGCIQSLGNRFIERIFESFLLTIHGREKIGLVKVVRLGVSHQSEYPLNSQMGTYHFSVEVDLDHTADRIADMDQLEEPKQRSNDGLLILFRLRCPWCLRVLKRLPYSHLIHCYIEPGF